MNQQVLTERTVWNMRIQKAHACRFLLLKNGLLGHSRLRGPEGVLAYIRQVGSLQYDSVDICGKSHELALLARVKGFSADLLDTLLYRDRLLVEFVDKNMCIAPAEDWPCLRSLRQSFRLHNRSRALVEAASPQLFEMTHQKGGLTMRDVVDAQLRSALAALHFQGDFIVHHRLGEDIVYAPAADCLSQALIQAPTPFANDRERMMWQVMRRIGAVGMLWNAPSDAWLGVEGLSAQVRNDVFAALVQLKAILPIEVEGVSQTLYLLMQDLPLLQSCFGGAPAERAVHMLPPLDCLLWDRRLIWELFGFSYKWEIFTPEQQRRYGGYVLPVLYGEGFIGRIEPVCDRQQQVLVIRRFWPEAGVRVSDRLLWALEDALQVLCSYHGLGRLVWADGWLAEP